MAIYWIYFDLPKQAGEMRLSVETDSREKATSIAKKKAQKMSKEWVHRTTECVR